MNDDSFFSAPQLKRDPLGTTFRSGDALRFVSFCTSALLVSASLIGCTGGLCSNDIIGTYPSPSGNTQAVVFVRNCGATTQYGTNVSILLSGDKLGDEAGNVFLVTTAPVSPAVPRNSIGGPQVDVKWLRGDTLTIAYPAGVEIRRQVVVERGIPIRYVIVGARGA